EIEYLELWGASDRLDGWHDSNDLTLVGDFVGAGHDQVLLLNRSGGGGRIMIADFSDGAAPAEIKYLEMYGQSSVLNGWHDDDDLVLAGDFVDLGYDQVMFINRSGAGGRVLIADFKDGAAPAEVRYRELHGQSSLLDGWHDDDDWVLAGDFAKR